MATVLAYAMVIYHCTYSQELVWHMAMPCVQYASHTRKFYMQINTCYTAFMRVDYYFISGHQESSQPFIVNYMFQLS